MLLDGFVRRTRSCLVNEGYERRTGTIALSLLPAVVNAPLLPSCRNRGDLVQAGVDRLPVLAYRRLPAGVDVPPHARLPLLLPIMLLSRVRFSFLSRGSGMNVGR